MKAQKKSESLQDLASKLHQPTRLVYQTRVLDQRTTLTAQLQHNIKQSQVLGQSSRPEYLTRLLDKSIGQPTTPALWATVPNQQYRLAYFTSSVDQHTTVAIKPGITNQLYRLAQLRQSTRLAFQTSKLTSILRQHPRIDTSTSTLNQQCRLAYYTSNQTQHT